MMSDPQAIISYGVKVPKHNAVPWTDYDDFTDWWREVNGYKDPDWCPFTEDGQYRPGISRDDPLIREFFEYVRQWDRAHPVPVELVNYGDYDDPAWIIAVPDLVIRVCGGAPLALSQLPLHLPASDEIALLQYFCGDNEILGEGPCWWLSSFLDE